MIANNINPRAFCVQIQSFSVIFKPITCLEQFLNNNESFTLAKVSTITPATVTCDSDTRQSLLTYLGHFGRRDTDRIVSIGQGKQIRGEIVCDITCDIVLNTPNVNTA